MSKCFFCTLHTLSCENFLRQVSRTYKMLRHLKCSCFCILSFCGFLLHRIGFCRRRQVFAGLSDKFLNSITLQITIFKSKFSSLNRQRQLLDIAKYTTLLSLLSSFWFKKITKQQQIIERQNRQKSYKETKSFI